MLSRTLKKCCIFTVDEHKTTLDTYQCRVEPIRAKNGSQSRDYPGLQLEQARKNQSIRCTQFSGIRELCPYIYHSTRHFGHCSLPPTNEDGVATPRFKRDDHMVYQLEINDGTDRKRQRSINPKSSWSQETTNRTNMIASRQRFKEQKSRRFGLPEKKSSVYVRDV